jgi:hypothetical protein
MPNPTVTYVLKGRVVSVDAAAGMAVVKVAKVNHQRHSGQNATVTFDLTNAKIAVADVNADTAATAADIAPGDRALGQARLPRRCPDLTGTVVAHKARRPDPSRAREQRLERGPGRRLITDSRPSPWSWPSDSCSQKAHNRTSWTSSRGGPRWRLARSWRVRPHVPRLRHGPRSAVHRAGSDVCRLRWVQHRRRGHVQTARQRRHSRLAVDAGAAAAAALRALR